MAVTSSAEICNMVLSQLSPGDTVVSLDPPQSDIEIRFSIVYDQTRRSLLKRLQPNFALSRVSVPKSSETPPLAETYQFQYFYRVPNDCLQVLGIAAIEDKENNYTVEQYQGVKYINHQDDFEEGLPLRYVKDITDVTLFDDVFIDLFVASLGSKVATAIMSDKNAAAQFRQDLKEMMPTYSSVNAFENRPIRISRSKFKESRFNRHPKRWTKL